jgi:hypothetical protein
MIGGHGVIMLMGSILIAVVLCHNPVRMQNVDVFVSSWQL